MDLIELLNETRNIDTVLTIEDKYRRFKEVMNEIESNIIKAKVNKSVTKQRYIPLQSNSKQEKSVKLIKCESVSTFNEIPSVPIYWVKNRKMYAIKINNVLFAGSIGNVDAKSNKRRLCKNGIKCINRECDYYHDPITIPWSNDIMNYHPSSFIYTQNNIVKNNIRNIININSLLVPMEEYIRLRNQVMHDLISTINIYNKC